ncbi:MAG: DNA-directed DNA polymerase II small subunit [Thermoplasmata archaeon]|nr:MAG: DNA-directed DNA polymerase II small subunit [Thermoplasmata archaeon]
MGMKEVVRLFSEKGILVDPDALDYISSKENPLEFAKDLLTKLSDSSLVLTLEDIKSMEGGSKEEEEITEVFNEIPVGTGEKVMAREYDAEVKIIKDVTGRVSCRGEVEDFAKLFNSRYQKIRNIFGSQRRGLRNPIPLKKLRDGKIKEAQVIGMVKDVRTTQKGYRIIELEDEEDTITVLVPKDDPLLYQQSQEIVYDEVISLRITSGRNGLFIAQSISYPDISITHKKNKAEIPVYVAFLSDTHIGSNKFMREEWNKMIRWLNGEIGNSRQRDVARKIKYIIMPGDIVDGVGVYPGQDKELDVTDVYKQYELLSKELERIPDHITIILQPGNHDAVRPAEPQPALEKEIQDLFSGKEYIFVGNPCYLSIHGVEILSYHGQSLLDFSTNIPNLRYNQPIEVMKIALKKRHLAPIYGGHTPIAPEHEDYMVIDRIPDIFVTGHVHVSAIGEYRGVTLINASAWQAQTNYQKMMNFVPDPAKLPVVDLRSGNATSMDFNVV